MLRVVLLQITFLMVTTSVRSQEVLSKRLYSPNIEVYPSELCFDDRNCYGDLRCIKHECQCPNAHKAHHIGKTCHPERNSGEECDVHIQCPLFERCVGGYCTCDKGYVRTAWDGCHPEALLYDLCFVSEQCILPHTSCINHRCHCSKGYGESVHSTCEPVYTTIKIRISNKHKNKTGAWEMQALRVVAKEFGQHPINQAALKAQELTYKNPHLITEKKHRKRRALSSLGGLIGSILQNVQIPGLNLGAVKTQPVPKLDQRCDQTSECFSVDHAICKNKACKCEDGYVANPQEDDQCYRELPLGQSCSFDEECPSNGKCLSTCQCNENHIEINEWTCAPEKQFGEFCLYPLQCSTVDSLTVCSHSECKCLSGYVRHGSTCLIKKKYSEICEQTIQCPTNQECSGTCQCKTDFIHVSNLGCLPELGLGSTCLVTKQCKAINMHTECSSVTSKCACAGNYIEYNGQCLPTILLGDGCQISIQCETTANAACIDNTCQCKEGYYQCTQSCLPEKLLNDVCTCSAQCTQSNTECTSNVCTCKVGYTLCSNSCEADKSIGEACSCSAQCKLANSICYDGKKCWCKDGYMYSNGGCQKKKLGEMCSTTSECVTSDPFSHCQSSTCSCAAPRTLGDNQQCQTKGASLDAFCSSKEECMRKDRYSTCGTGARCLCLPSFTNVNGVCTKKVSSLGSSCSTCIECMRSDKLSECVNEVCVCSEIAGATSDPHDPHKCKLKGCGSSFPSVASAVTIQSPELADGFYWNNADCTWTFSTSLTGFKVVIEYFAVESMDFPDICLLDYVTITNNDACTITLCGNYETETTMYIPGNEMTITFASNEKFRKKGFKLEITPVNTIASSESCQQPLRNKEIVSWTNGECCLEPADDLEFETNVLRNLDPVWYPSSVFIK